MVSSTIPSKSAYIRLTDTDVIVIFSPGIGDTVVVEGGTDTEFFLRVAGQLEDTIHVALSCK